MEALFGRISFASQGVCNVIIVGESYLWGFCPLRMMPLLCMYLFIFLQDAPGSEIRLKTQDKILKMFI